MTRFLGLLILVVAGWAAWFYVVQPALHPSASGPAATPLARHATATPQPQLNNQAGAVAARARRFLDAWTAGQFDAMYGELSPSAQTAISRTAFTTRYHNIANEATITGVHTAVDATTIQGPNAIVRYHAAIATTALGLITYTNTMPLRYQGGQWGIKWTPDLIFPGLGTAYRIHLFHEPSLRGTIVDRQGHPLAIQGNVLEVGVVPYYIRDEPGLLAFLSGWLHMPAARIKAMYHVSWAVQNPTDFVPIAAVTSVQWDAVKAQALQQMNNGLDVQQGLARRLYPNGALAAPLLGYVTSTDGHGAVGLELWADKYLSSQDGAKLTIATAPDFSYVVSTIKEHPPQDGDTVHLTLDSTLQAAAERYLKGKVGAVVALRPSDGAVLAMASVPGFDPNSFVNGLTAAQYHALVASPHQPLINRAATGQYPLGSVFKIVTMGAALEKGNFTAATQIPGPGIWYGLGPNYPMKDWLPTGHGIISLHEALVQSCDTCFYQVGQALDTIDHYLLPNYARAWGFGSPTGIVGVGEAPGLIPDPHWTLTALNQPWVPGDAVNMAIGQGYVLVTPLQVAQMLAALGDNGVMHRPYVISRITGTNGAVIRAFKPVVSRVLPLSAKHRLDILEAMLGVTTEPYGTAVDKFAGFRWPVAGKTGTAQATNGAADAWFVALAPADRPRIALVVLVEHGGEGSQVAAPIARKLLDVFFTQDQDLAGIGKGPPVLPVP